MRIGYDLIMLDIDKTLPEDPDELRQFTALLLAEVRSQAVLIEKLRHQLAANAITGLDHLPRVSSNCNWLWKRAR